MDLINSGETKLASLLECNVTHFTVCVDENYIIREVKFQNL